MFTDQKDQVWFFQENAMESSRWIHLFKTYPSETLVLQDRRDIVEWKSFFSVTLYVFPGDYVPYPIQMSLPCTMMCQFPVIRIFSEKCQMTGFFLRINEIFLLLYCCQNWDYREWTMKSRILKERIPSSHGWKFWQWTKILSVWKVHFSSFNCFLWLLLEILTVHTLMKGAEKNAAFEIFIRVAPLAINFLDSTVKFC